MFETDTDRGKYLKIKAEFNVSTSEGLLEVANSHQKLQDMAQSLPENLQEPKAKNSLTLGF